ncbi:MAG: cobyrinate a,c-diamide synthase [Dehalococcoidales bacterium]
MVSSQPQNQATQWPPRIVIAAPQGRSGKTIISVGLCAAFRQRGFVVQPFKKGPDYIDPSWLTATAGRSCRNLDAVLMSEETLLTSFQRACRGADVALIEGAMGLYDGFDSTGRGSTAQISRLLRSPVILIVNATRMTRSIAAMVTGYQRFEPETNIAGVILNNVAGSRHEHKLVTAVEQYCGIPVVGSIPKDLSLSITERHLGLIPYWEAGQETVINNICQRLEKNLNLNGILDIARSAKGGCVVDTVAESSKATVVKLGVMLDRIFTFYYPENLEALTRAGAELVFIDSMQDQQLPDIDGLYIGGGFPELFLPELEANSRLRQHIAQAIKNYLPVYAECAGLMYLCQVIRWHGEQHEMVGVIPAEVELRQRPQAHGYVMVEVAEENPLFPVGLTFWGHEFHHSRLTKSNDLKFAYRVRRGQGIDGRADGIVYKNVFAAYTHLHALGVSQWAEAFVSQALRERKCQPSFLT